MRKRDSKFPIIFIYYYIIYGSLGERQICAADGEFANKLSQRLRRTRQKNRSEIRLLINLVQFFCESLSSFLIKNSFYSIYYGRGSLSTMLASMSRFQPSFHFIHFPWHTRTRSILPCVLREQNRGWDSRDGCKAPMLLFRVACSWGPFLHSQRDLKRCGRSRANTL